MRGVWAVLAVIVIGGLAVAQTNVSGNWSFKINNPQGTNEPTMTLEQEGDAITGTMRRGSGEIPVAGTISGSGITLSYEINAPQVGQLTIALIGTVDGSEMTGTMSFSGQEGGSVTAVKN